MKKSNKLFLFPLLMVTPLISCAPTKPEPQNDTYSVTVIDENDMAVNDSNMMVQWCNVSSGICLTPVPLSNEGKATVKSKLTSTFIIHLVNVKKGYTYNPNIYTCDENNRDVTIKLYPVNDDLSLADSTLSNSPTNPYLISSNNYYRVEFLEASSHQYVGFHSNEGQYRLSSLVANTFNTYGTKVAVNSLYGDSFLTATNELAGNNTATDGVNFIYNININNSCYVVFDLTVLENLIYPITVDFYFEMAEA